MEKFLFCDQVRIGSARFLQLAFDLHWSGSCTSELELELKTTHSQQIVAQKAAIGIKIRHCIHVQIVKTAGIRYRCMQVKEEKLTGSKGDSTATQTNTKTTKCHLIEEVELEGKGNINNEGGYGRTCEPGRRRIRKTVQVQEVQRE